MIPVPNDSGCVLILIRHGATENNLADPTILQGRSATPGLSETGRQQAHASSGQLRDLPIGAIFASPLIRAVQTAEIIADPHQLQVNQITQLTEVDVGEWENRSWAHIAVEDPEPYNEFMSNPAENGYLGGESFNDVFHRVAPAMTDLLESNLGKTIVVVAHNIVNRVFLANSIGIPLSRSRDISQENCGINVLKFENGKTKLKTLNATFHLPAD